jgi:hypothetical protein
MTYWKSAVAGFITFCAVAILFALATTGLDLTYPGAVWYGVLPLKFEVGGGAPLLVKAVVSGFVILLSVIGRLLIASVIGILCGAVVYAFGWVFARMFKGNSSNSTQSSAIPFTPAATSTSTTQFTPPPKTPANLVAN